MYGGCIYMYVYVYICMYIMYGGTYAIVVAHATYT